MVWRVGASDAYDPRRGDRSRTSEREGSLKAVVISVFGWSNASEICESDCDVSIRLSVPSTSKAPQSIHKLNDSGIDRVAARGEDLIK